ncbi:MAG: ornithine cyclodeaminase [Pseudomonadota bacterium]
MRTPVTVTAQDIRRVATWPMVVEAIRDGHRLPKAHIGDTFVHGGGNTMLVRSAWIEGLAAGVKAATVVPKNPDRGMPSVHAQIMLFDPDTGELAALVDGTEVTAWKTAADSGLGCDLLSREDAKTLLMVGAGAMAEPLICAHLSVRPSLTNILLWNRSTARVEALSQRLEDLSQSVEIVDSVEVGAARADIICCATMSATPVLQGAWVPTGCHVDLVGAFKPDMREADDDLHCRASWFVDSYDTTLDHIGELKIPLAEGVIDRDAVKGDLHALVAGDAGRSSPDEITVFKNGGGAHLDIMVSDALVKAVAEQSTS